MSRNIANPETPSEALALFSMNLKLPRQQTSSFKLNVAYLHSADLFQAWTTMKACSNEAHWSSKLFILRKMEAQSRILPGLHLTDNWGLSRKTKLKFCERNLQLKSTVSCKLRKRKVWSRSDNLERKLKYIHRQRIKKMNKLTQNRIPLKNNPRVNETPPSTADLKT